MRGDRSRVHLPFGSIMGKTIDYGLASFYTHARAHDADLLGFR